MHKTLLFIGPQLNGDPKQNPGGQLSSATGLINYFEKEGFKVKVVNTVQPSFPPPGVIKKIWGSILRVLKVSYILCTTNTAGCIIYCGALSSFIERFLICLLCKLKRVRTLLFTRNSSLLKLKPQTFLARSFKIGLNLSDGIVVQGDRWVKHLSNLGIPKDRLHIIPNWLSSDSFPRENNLRIDLGERVNFIFVGWLVEDKGIAELLETAKILKAQSYNFSLTLVGGGTLYEFSKGFVKNNSLGDIVKILGWKDRTEVDQLLKESHVFVLPTYHEGFPNALMEAMSLGLPAISTDVGAIAESLLQGQNGYIIEVADVASLSVAMSRYLKDISLIEAHSKATLQIVKKRHSRESNCFLIKKLLFDLDYKHS